MFKWKDGKVFMYVFVLMVVVIVVSLVQRYGIPSSFEKTLGSILVSPFYDVQEGAIEKSGAARGNSGGGRFPPLRVPSGQEDPFAFLMPGAV